MGNIIGTIKFAFEVKYDKHKGKKLIGIQSCEENMPKFATYAYARQVMSAMKILLKYRLIPTSRKASHLKNTHRPVKDYP